MGSEVHPRSMSPFTIVPPPVDASKPESPSPVFWIGLALVALSTLAGGYQWWLLYSDFARLMYQTVVANPRVREEFGAGVEARAKPTPSRCEPPSSSWTPAFRRRIERIGSEPKAPDTNS
jgi:hypothetical protein